MEKKICNRCQNNKHVSVLGIDEESKKRIFQCTCIDMGTDRPYRFDSDGVSFTGRLKVIKCPVCEEGRDVVLNGNSTYGFICKNKEGHKSDKVNNFVFKNNSLVSLKTYLNDIDPDIYTYFHKLHTRRKRLTKQSLVDEDIEDIQSCLELGLNQKIISGIFHVNQSSVSRFIKKKKITCDTEMKYIVKQVKEKEEEKVEKRIFYTTLQVNKKRFSEFQFDVEE